ncbi:hypothetical protein B0H16DRAFT_1512449 [Mycena metata]|uniref:PX domain-containing protein n=1 Tax=Mycena metata TaxID=1033252 RepID=A0AAD7NT43_9AGAR|nr:hypothetical protein B0H16DRAFT_1512449 [Mycena metata]
MRPNNIPGQEEGPSSPDSWKRAVYRPAPSHFTVEMLPPVKLGGNYNFKLRICPVARGDRSSVSSRGSNIEYEVLRRWEDCLIFQDGLEREYSRLAVSKRQRLLAGKGVRKNGIYLHGDRASSWESLPPGPEPDSVAQSIHDLVPRLTKKGTMFRASQATIDQRQAELTAFIAALFQENVPTLLQDFRRERIVTDFFGFWRRDQDIQKTSNKTSKARRNSTTSSFFSPGSLEDYDFTRGRADSSASSDSSSVVSSGGSARSSVSVQIMLDDQPVPFGHNPNLGVDTLAPLRDTTDLTRANSRSRGGFLSAVVKRVRKTSGAESVGSRPRQSLDEAPPRPDSRASDISTVHRPNRDSWETTASGMTFLDDLNLTLPKEEEDARSSRMSMASIATFRTEVSSEGIIPRYYVPEPNPARLSTATFMTDVSADAIIPRSPRSRRTDSVLSDEESVLDEYFYDAFPRPCSFVPEAPQQSRPETPVGQMQSASSSASLTTPTESPTKASHEGAKITSPPSPSRSLPYPTSSDSKRPKSPTTPILASLFQRKEALAMARAPSPNGSVLSASTSVLSEQSTFSDSTGTTITPSLYSFYSARSTLSTATTISSTAGSPLVIKAAHNDSIILLRAAEELSLTEIRWRLREKFLGQEGITLSEKFTLAYMIPAVPSKGSVQARGRSNSLSSAAALDSALMEIISTEADWAQLRASLDGAKLTLRVLDSASSPSS